MQDVKCPCGSDLNFSNCHGLRSALPVIARSATVEYQQPIVVAPAPITLKLDLACGQSTAAGFEGVDIAPGPTVKHVHDLQKYPWPWADSSVAELHCSHYIEHIPMEYLLHGGRMKDALFAFFDECYRILKPDGWLFVAWPFHRSDRAFWDPTHRRFIACQVVFYMNRDWRVSQKLDHYAVDCNFGVWYPDRPGNGCDAVPIVAEELTRLHPEAAARKLNAEWNVGIDWHARLQAKKPQ